MKSCGLNVPEIYEVNARRDCYLQQDLGQDTLFDFISQARETEGFSEKITDEYKKVICELPKIQVVAGAGIDYSKCYPRQAFDKQSMMWDLNYFKYYFLKLAKIAFDEQALEDDFQVFSDYLLSAESRFFMYRDFQSRNVMLKDGQPWFIDYQGGRRGALQYDLASLLYDGKADIPPAIRKELYAFYISELKKYHTFDPDTFGAYYTGFVLIRIMQAMGAYGFRGFYEKKEHFLKSIPFALDNLENLLGDVHFPVEAPELLNVLAAVTQSKFLRSFGSDGKKLTVSITSFSYKKGLPHDSSGNGGGFVFDCRAIPNPGKFPEYKELTGKDKKVQDFIEANGEMDTFMDAVTRLVGQSVQKYIERGFSHLSVSFGCTGGQHRSVYAAEKLSGFIRNKFPVHVVLKHREQQD